MAIEVIDVDLELVEETRDWIEKVEGKERELKGLYARMETDQNLYRLAKFTMKDFNEKKVPKVRNMTLPDAKIFGNKVVGTLKRAHMQTEIELDEDKDNKGASKLEKFFDSYFYKIDEEFSNRGIRGGFDGTSSGQSAIRGWLAYLSSPYVKNNKFYTGVRVWDTQFVSFEHGMDGLLWAACRMTRNKLAIKGEFNYEISGDDAEVIDIWTTTKNIVFVDNEVVRDEEHGWTDMEGNPVCPVVIEGCDAGVFMRDDEYQTYEGESIYDCIRDLIDDLNGTASVFNTLNYRAFQGSTQLTGVEDPNNFNLNGGSPYGEREVVVLKKGEEFKPIPIQDVKNSTTYLLNLIESRLQRGSLPATDYGSISFPMSAVAIKGLGESADTVYLPRFDQRARAKQALCKIIASQWLTLKPTEAKFEAPDDSVMKGNWELTFRYWNISPVENVADYAVAGEASKYFAPEDVIKEVLRVEDPDAAIRRRRAYEAETVSPLLFKWRRANALLEDGKEFEAALMVAEMGFTIEDMMNPQVDSNKMIQAAEKQAQMQQQGGGTGLSLPDLVGGTGRAGAGQLSSQQESAQMKAQQGVTGG